MRFLRSGLAASLLLSLAGCFASVPLPGNKEGETKYVFKSEDIEILGPVSAEGSVTILLSYFIFEDQNFGYVALVEAARRDLGADTVIDVVVDRHATAFLGLLFGRHTWRATGTAIRYKQSLRAFPVPPSPVSRSPTAATAVTAAAIPTEPTGPAPVAPPAAAPVGEQAFAPRPTPGETATGVSFGFRGAYVRPLGLAGGSSIVAGDVEMTDIAEAYIIPAWLDLGYRLSERHYVGAYGAYGMLQVPCGKRWVTVGQFATETTTQTECSGYAVRGGANWQYRIPVSEGFAPWMGVGLGVERLKFTEKRKTDLSGGITLPGETVTETGTMTSAEVLAQLGFDLRAGTFGIGPFAAVSVGQTLDGELPAPVGKLTGDGVHYNVFGGMRLVYR